MSFFTCTIQRFRGKAIGKHLAPWVPLNFKSQSSYSKNNCTPHFPRRSSEELPSSLYRDRTWVASALANVHIIIIILVVRALHPTAEGDMGSIPDIPVDAHWLSRQVRGVMAVRGGSAGWHLKGVLVGVGRDRKRQEEGNCHLIITLALGTGFLWRAQELVICVMYYTWRKKKENTQNTHEHTHTSLTSWVDNQGRVKAAHLSQRGFFYSCSELVEPWGTLLLSIWRAHLKNRDERYIYKKKSLRTFRKIFSRKTMSLQVEIWFTA